MAPPSGHNLICKNPPLPDQHNQSEPKGVSEKCQSLSCIPCWQPPSLPQCTGQCPSPTQEQCLLKLLTMEENRQQQQSLNMPQHRPHQQEEIRRLTKKSSVKRRIGPGQREIEDKYWSIISEVEGGAGVVRTQERPDSVAFLLHVYFLLFTHKAMVAAVTVILAIAHLTLQCCSRAT